MHDVSKELVACSKVQGLAADLVSEKSVSGKAKPVTDRGPDHGHIGRIEGDSVT